MPCTLQRIWLALLLCALLVIIFTLPFIAFDSEREVEAPFLSKEGSDQALVFFGFSHCAGVCPTTLTVLQNLLKDQTKYTVRPQIAFIDIDSNSNQQKAQGYARSFHPSFIGVHAQAEQLKTLTRDFGLNIRQSKEEIIHRGRTYLLSRSAEQWQIVKTYNPDSFDWQQLYQDVSKRKVR